MFAQENLDARAETIPKQKKGEFVGDVFMVLRFKSIQAHFSILP